MANEKLVEYTLDAMSVWGWVVNDSCAMLSAADPRFQFVLVPKFSGNYRGTKFYLDVGIRSFRHQRIADFVTEGAETTGIHEGSRGQNWYQHFFAGGNFQSALGRHVGFDYTVRGTIAEKRATIDEALHEVNLNIRGLASFASDISIHKMSKRDPFGPWDVGVAVCATLLGQGVELLKQREERPVSWYLINSYPKIISRLGFCRTSGISAEIAAAQAPEDLPTLAEMNGRYGEKA